jgi:hypothetical protein
LSSLKAERSVKVPTSLMLPDNLIGIYLAHYAVRVLLAQAAIEAAVDPDRLSFSEGLFELTEMISLALAAQALALQDGSASLTRSRLTHQSTGSQAGLQQVQSQEARPASA